MYVSRSSGLYELVYCFLARVTDDGFPSAVLNRQVYVYLCVCVVPRSKRNVHAQASCPSQPHYETMSVVTSITSQGILPRRKRADLYFACSTRDRKSVV